MLKLMSHKGYEGRVSKGEDHRDMKSLKASSLEALWWQGGKRKESLQLGLRNLNICIEKDDVKC